MEITPGRAMYSPDEELKPLRQPKTYHPEVTATPSTLSINAAEFVPRYSAVITPNIQERLQVHQKQHIQKNYHQYQQSQPQTQQPLQQQQYQQQPQSYSNGYANQQQLQQQYQQSSQNMNNQMGSLSISNVQDRLRTGNSGGNRGGEAGGYYYQQQQQHGNGGQQPDYQQSNHYRYNKNQHHQQQQQQPHQHQHQHHNQHQHRYSNHHNQQQQQQQQQLQQQYHQQNQQQLNASGMGEPCIDMDTIALDYLQTVIQCLNQNPGQFDCIATRFNYKFEGMENNHFVLSNAMEDIFNESIRNSNFRYMGAKLYNLLHTLNPSKDSLFLAFLKSKLEFHRQEVREYIQAKQEAKVRETALFLAELYMQLRGEDSRNYLIAENIVFSLKELLSLDDNKDNIRCICLTLKLAGYDLSTDCPDDMVEIISKLDAINCQNPGKYPLASNVISLQKNNWGRKQTGAVTQSEPDKIIPVAPLRVSDDPVFYGPDGHEITAEECEFLTNGAAGTATSSDNEEENDDVDLDSEMDEETERDFKLFLKQSNNKS